MTRSKRSPDTGRSITFRVTTHQYNLFARAAEEKNMSNSELGRLLIDDYINLKNMNFKIEQLEKRLERRIFEMVAAIADIDDQQRLQARKKYRSNLQPESKS